ncbi:hypothetical protein [Candidatus Rhodobacter oscarellae]|uniref:hypothetical protein n=1 Tax=Candidatus Rhodobacter oscarellae TaxID=1675527 RepID=UPI001F25C8A7|nr:hypothetical protein [Candidatus Rhodobacter lobularis]
MKSLLFSGLLAMLPLLFGLIVSFIDTIAPAPPALRADEPHVNCAPSCVGVFIREGTPEWAEYARGAILQQT